MPSVEYFLVCRSVSVDVHTDEVTLSGVIDDVDLEEDGIAFIPRAIAVGAWNIAPGDADKDHQALLRIKRPGEAEGKDFPVNLSEGRKRYRAIFSILDIPLDKPGELVFEVLLNAASSATHRVFVHAAGARAPQVDPKFKQANPQPKSDSSSQ